MELISNCCSATVYDDTDVCSDCGEHCGAVDINNEEEVEYEFIINKWQRI